MEDLKNIIDNQIEILKRMIFEDKSREEIEKQKNKLDRLLEEYVERLK